MVDLPEDLLRAFLAGRDFGCPVCRYNLRDLQTQLCPECGTKIRLQVDAPEADQTAAIAGLIGLAAGAGFSGLLIVYFLIRLTIDQFDPSFGYFLFLTATPFIIESVLSAVWLWNWRRIRICQWGSKWLLATGCWVISVINVVTFALIIN